jgi:SET domain-containing protein
MRRQYTSDVPNKKGKVESKPMFAVRRSRIDGNGLFSVTAISQRRKIGELNGERISQREARLRARTAQRVAIVELRDGTAIDGACNGNQFRFINHSCSPNLYMRVCEGRVEFYALRDIQPGEELTCDYGHSHHDGTLRCCCGSARCHGYI